MIKLLSILKEVEHDKSKYYGTNYRPMFWSTGDERHTPGHCRYWAYFAAKFLLSKGRTDFKVIDGMVSFQKPDKKERSFEEHVYLKFDNGRIFDPSIKQFKKMGYDLSTLQYPSDSSDIIKAWKPKSYIRDFQRSGALRSADVI